jgi:hypothetical protein
MVNKIVVTCIFDEDAPGYRCTHCNELLVTVDVKMVHGERIWYWGCNCDDGKRQYTREVDDE